MKRGKIDYTVLALPKTGRTGTDDRKTRRRAVLKAGAIDRDTHVMQRHGGRCVAHGISPVCTKRAEDPHELIPRSAGGPLESWNRVPICWACHRMTQKTLGGTRLQFDWPGKASGERPKADQPGHVTPVWRRPIAKGPSDGRRNDQAAGK